MKTHVARILMKLGLRDRVQVGRLRLRARPGGAGCLEERAPLSVRRAGLGTTGAVRPGPGVTFSPYESDPGPPDDGSTSPPSKDVVLVTKRLQTLGVVLAVIGLGFLAGAGVAYAKVQAGYDSLKAFSAAQNVELSYNDDGQLADRGETKGAEAIMSLLRG